MAEGAACLDVQLMGIPQISIKGIPLTVNHLKSRALLFYLAATGGPHSRDHLAALLWGESGQSEAYHSLRSSLYRLRKAMQSVGAGEALLSDGESLRLAPTFYRCDVIDFERLLAEENEHTLSQAVGFRRGPFLQGFTLRDAPEFDDWMQIESTRLNQACLEALDRLITWAESHEAWAVAIRYAQQMIQIDPFAESAHQRLMRFYVRNREVGLALRQYRQMEKQFKQDFGILPSDETKRLYEEILRQQPVHAVPSNVLARQSHLLPFVGRDDLLHELSTISEEVRSGQGATVLIQGEGGIGKSRLLNEFASPLRSDAPPWLILEGACSPFDDLLSQGPFIEALQNGIAENFDDFMAEADRSAPDARGRFFWRVLQTLRSMALTAPLMLFIEDLHWANSSTLNLFGFLAMRLHHLPVMLVGTVQHADDIPALQRLITLGRRHRELHLLTLAPLTLKAISNLLQASHVNADSVEVLANWLDTKSTGNPFLLSEILAQLRTEGILKRTGDDWQLDLTRWLRWRNTFSLPETTYDLVSWRLANIRSEARNLLDLLAVSTKPVPESVLRSIPGLWTDLFPTLVDQLSARGLILELEGGSTLTLPHHLLRETLLHRLSNLRRRSIHRQLAEAMEIPGTFDEIWLRQIALHAVAGEDVNRARRYGMKLLSSLPHEYTGAETVDFVHHLYDLLAPTAAAEEMIRITRALGLLHQSLGHLELAAYWHQQNLSWAEKTGNHVAQAETYFEMGELALMSIDYHTAAQMAREGLANISDQPLSIAMQSLTGRGHRLLGASLAMEGRDLAAAEDHLQKAVEVQRQIENLSDLCAVLFELGNVAAQRGELQRALDFYEESARAAEAGRVYYYLALAHNNFAYHSLLLGRVNEARQSVSQGIKIAETYDLLAALLHLYSTKGEIFLYLEDWQEAEESFRRGLALAEELSSLERQAGYRGGLALVARGRKDFAGARHLLEEALNLIVDQGYLHLRTRLQLWLAETLFEQADYEEASHLLDEVLSVARAQKRALLVEQGVDLQNRLLALMKK